MVELRMNVWVFDELKYIVNFVGKFFVLSKERKVVVDLSGFFVKVTSTDMGVLNRYIVFHTGDKTKLRVNL